MNLLGLREGVLHAKLDWTNEAQAVKQGWATMLTMLLCWGVILATGALWLMWLAELVSAEAFCLASARSFFALDALLLRWVKTTGAERFSAPILTRVLPSGRQVFSVLPTCQASAFAV